MAKIVAYTVRGHWPFPTDMLRHDGSQAATPADQQLIDSLSQDHAPDRAAFKDVEISLVGPSKPNTARWESFRWEVPADAEHAFYRRAREEERRRKVVVAGALAKLTSEEQEALRWHGLR